jgi:hypothetical protein
MLAAGTHLRAAPNRIPRRVSPLDGRSVTHNRSASSGSVTEQVSRRHGLEQFRACRGPVPLSRVTSTVQATPGPRKGLNPLACRLPIRLLNLCAADVADPRYVMHGGSHASRAVAPFARVVYPVHGPPP